MMKLILNLLEIYIIVKVVYKTTKILTGKAGKKTIPEKVFYLCKKQVNASLDRLIKKKKSLAATQQSNSNVVPFIRKKA
jgi:hypothetical protein